MVDPCQNSTTGRSCDPVGDLSTPWQGRTQTGECTGARKAPQEKKELSYARDRRNNGGDTAKASRKNIPLRKRLVNRANRHSAHQLLSAVVGIADPSLDEAVEQKVASKRPKSWRKRPDIPRAEHLERQSRWRDSHKKG